MRQVFRKHLASLDKREKRLVSYQIIEQFFTMFGHLSPCTVAGYWPLVQELDICPLLRTLHICGWCCTLPVVVRRDHPLDFRLWEPGQVLSPDSAKIPAPLSTQSCLTPRIIFVPALGFDREGFRLGHGGGYYDRTLMTLRNTGSLLAIGIGFSIQMVDRLPHTTLDQRVDAFLSERLILRFS